MRHLLIGLLGMVIGSTANHALAAQREHLFQPLQINAEARLQQPVAMLQGDQGFVWIATDNALHRYDGHSLLTLHHNPSDPASLPPGRLTALTKGPEHSLYVGSSTRFVYRLDLESGKFSPLQAGDIDTAAPDLRVRALLYQAERGLWVGTDAGIDLINTRTATRQVVLRFGRNPGLGARQIRLALGTDEQLFAATDEGLYRIDTSARVAERMIGMDAASSVLLDHRGQLWAGGLGRLYRLPPQQDSLELVALHPTLSEAKPIDAIAEDPQGRIWFAADGRLYRRDGDGGTTTLAVTDVAADMGAPSIEVQQLMMDGTGLLWVASRDQGIFTTHSRGNTFRLIHDDAAQTAMANSVLAIAAAEAGSVWLGTEGAGLRHYVLATDRFSPGLTQPVDAQSRLPDAVSIKALATNDDGRLWLASSAGLIERLPDGRHRRHRLDSSIAASLTALAIAPDQTLWIGTRNAGVLRYDPASATIEQRFNQSADAPNRLDSNQINALHMDSRHRLWIGSENGLALVMPDAAQLQRLRHDTSDPQSISGDVILSISETADGSLWVGSPNGLDRLHPAPATEIPRIERVALSQNQIGDGILAVLEDRNGRLWLSSDAGILRLDPGTGKSHRYRVGDGLQSTDFHPGAALQLADHSLLFGGRDGIDLLAADWSEPSTYKPPVMLTSAMVGFDTPIRQPLLPPQSLHFSEAADVLHLSFAGLDFGRAGQQRYRYRLDGVDPAWVEVGSTRFAVYSDLAPGNYRFHAEVGDDEGRWSSQALELPITVTPTVWNSIPARLAYLLIATGLVLWYLQKRRLRLQQSRILLHQLQEREERLKLALWGSGDEFWDWDLRENTLYRIGAEQLLGQDASQNMSTDDWRSRAVHPDDLPKVQQRIQSHILGEAEFYESEHRVRNADGNYVWVRSRGKIVARDADGNPLRIAGTAADVTGTRRAERERRIASEVLRSMSEAVAVIDLDFNFISINPAFSRITGYEVDSVIGRNTSILDSSQHSTEFYRRTREMLIHSGHWQGEMWQRRRDGEEFLGWIELNEVRDNLQERTHFVSVINDITDKKRAEQELRYLANYDTLTGLPNRTLLSERLARAVVRARRQEAQVAVLFLDLDRFKDVNDSLGHAAGDRILKAAAARLLTTVRETDTVARLGGDEFTVVLEDIESTQVAEDVARKIIAAFAQPLELDGRSEVVISPSIGISLYPDHGLVPSDLLKFADTAMYQAKDHGRNTFQIYTRAMDAEARGRATMISALRKALERGEFRLVYQPRMTLHDGRITGVEALLRWYSEDIGEVLPSTFIPLAEETGLILPIGEWVMREACLTLHRWRDAGLVDLSMAINVSVGQFLRGHLPQRLGELIRELALDPAQLELEVTESMVMANAEQATSVLLELRHLGIKLAIDDFGTGYSSLVYLKRLPIDTLKIDKEFIGDLTTDPDDEAITATVINMAHSLGLNVIAEGVETAEQLAYLHEQGCDEIQGYWLSAPLEVHHCLQFIRQHQPQPMGRRNSQQTRLA